MRPFLRPFAVLGCLAGLLIGGAPAWHAAASEPSEKQPHRIAPSDDLAPQPLLTREISRDRESASPVRDLLPHAIAGSPGRLHGERRFRTATASLADVPLQPRHVPLRI